MIRAFASIRVALTATVDVQGTVQSMKARLPSLRRIHISSPYVLQEGLLAAVCRIDSSWD